jgi:predicted ATPase
VHQASLWQTDRSHGIPLFVEELTKSLLEGGLLSEEDGRYLYRGPLRELAIPSSLHFSRERFANFRLWH